MKKFNITVNGTAYEVEVEEIGAAAPAPAPAPAAASAAPVVEGGYNVTCPMPATIVDLKVSVGAPVKSGDLLVVFEAMKMENDIIADRDGTVAAIYVNKGDTVDSGKVLLSIQ